MSTKKRAIPNPRNTISFCTKQEKETNKEFLWTNGLKETKGYEIKVCCQKLPEKSYEALLSYISHYLFSESPVVKDNQTIAFYSWLLQFRHVPKQGCYELWELQQATETFVQGGDYALQVWEEQKSICKHVTATPDFPTFNQKIAITEDVYHSPTIEAVRYHAPPHMTGWYLTTPAYDDDPSHLLVVHFYHIALRRPDLLPLLALPSGFRFVKDQEKHHISFDESVAEADD